MTLDDAMNMIADWLGDQATAQDVADVARWGRENDQLVYDAAQDAFVFAESFDALTVLETLEASARDSQQTII